MPLCVLAAEERGVQAPEQKSLSEAADSVGCAGVKIRQLEALCRRRRGRGMKDVELYARVRYAVQVEGLSVSDRSVLAVNLFLERSAMRHGSADCKHVASSSQHLPRSNTTPFPEERSAKREEARGDRLKQLCVERH